MGLLSYSSDEIYSPLPRWRSENQEVQSGRLEFIRATPKIKHQKKKKLFSLHSISTFILFFLTTENVINNNLFHCIV